MIGGSTPLPSTTLGVNTTEETRPVREIEVRLWTPHARQREFIESPAKRKIIRAGRRGGKTVGAAILAVQQFLAGRRVLYTAPTSEQTDAFWYEVKLALFPLVDAGVYKFNQSERWIEKAGTQNRIKAKTAWDADSLRGDYADLLIFDEWQLTNEDAWQVVGAPMLLDNNGDAVFIYTPPSLLSTGVSKAHDPRHAAKLFAQAQADTTRRWAAFHFTTHDNPHISHEALLDLERDMSASSYRQEILAEDDDIQTSWLVYRSFNAARRRCLDFQIPVTWHVYSGHDFGAANPAALFFAQVQLPLPPDAPSEMRFNDLVCFKEYLPGGLSAPQHVNDWKQIVGGRRVVKSVGGNVTTEEQTRQLYRMHGWPISAPTITHVNAQVDRVRGMMDLDKIWVMESCRHYLDELANCLWVVGTDGRPTDKIKDEARFHLSACARYLLSDFRPETVTKGTPDSRVSNPFMLPADRNSRVANARSLLFR